VPDLRIDPDLFMEFLPIVADGTAQDITDWLREHVTNDTAAFQFMQTLPRMSAALCPMLMGGAKARPDESWVIRHLSDTPSEQASEQAVQMLVAALNDDADVLTGIILAVLNSPEDHLARVMVNLIAQLRDFVNLTRKKAIE